MTLRQKQSLFARHVACLIERAFDMGLEVTFGECYRTDEQAEINAIGQLRREKVANTVRRLEPALAEAIRNNGKFGGIRNSLHCDRLAIDLNLFHRGRYLASVEDHRPLGEWWEQQHPLARWGGRFGDGNHYSMEHEGRK